MLEVRLSATVWRGTEYRWRQPLFRTTRSLLRLQEGAWESATNSTTESQAAQASGGGEVVEQEPLLVVRQIVEPPPLELSPRVFREDTGGLLPTECLDGYLRWHRYLQSVLDPGYGGEAELDLEVIYSLAPKVTTFLCRGLQLHGWLSDDIDVLSENAPEWETGGLAFRLEVARALRQPDGLYEGNVDRVRNFLRVDNWNVVRKLVVERAHDIRELAGETFSGRLNASRTLFVADFASNNRLELI